MKTDDLVLMLATGAGAVAAKAPLRRYLVAVGCATLVATLVMAIWLGVRPTLTGDMDQPMLWIKEIFCIALVAVGLFMVARLARPGAGLAWAPAVLAAPLLAMWGLAVFDLLAASPEDRTRLLLGISWTECPYNIVVLSVPIFVAIVWAMKGLAPTRLRLAGAAAGFASGAIGALVYSLHCPELAAPFVGVWYVIGMLIPTAVGALIGPRLLRW
jgi:hypothetical protein